MNQFGALSLMNKGAEFDSCWRMVKFGALWLMNKGAELTHVGGWSNLGHFG